jgi:hypothetical protein
MNIVKKDNHYIIEFKFIPGETVDLKYIYTPDYFEELGFFTKITVYPSIQTGGQGDSSVITDITEDKTITFPYNIYVKMISFFSKDLDTFDFTKANEIWNKNAYKSSSESEVSRTSSSSDFFHNVNKTITTTIDTISNSLNPSNEKKYEVKEGESISSTDTDEDKEMDEKCKESIISKPIHEGDIIEPSNYEKIVIELKPFDSEGRIIEQPIQFKDFIEKRLKKRDERIENEMGLTYGECLQCLDMLKKQRTHRMNKLIKISYIEDDMYMLDGRFVILGRHFEKDNDTEDVRNANMEYFKEREKELVGYKELEGTKRIE